MEQLVGPLQLNSEQAAALVELHDAVCQQLIQFKFNDPANDDLQIRQHAALSGREELLRQLLDFDGALKAEQQSRFNSILDN